MTLYFIKDWQLLFETNETRKLKALTWWPKPNKHDGIGFRRMARERDKVALFCAWNLIGDIASKTTPKERRGYLERDGRPLDAEDMSVMTDFPAEIFTRALGFFGSSSVGWLCAESAGTPGESPAVQKGKKGMERPEGKGIDIPTHARIVLGILNDQTGKHFRELDSSLTPIIERLSEPDVTLEGVKLMISRQVKMWKGTEMSEYLRPETLFGKTKFNSYYAAKDQPLPPVKGAKPSAESNQLQETIEVKSL